MTCFLWLSSQSEVLMTSKQARSEIQETPKSPSKNHRPSAAQSKRQKTNAASFVSTQASDTSPESEPVAPVDEGVHHTSDEAAYIWPSEPEVLEALERFRDQKLGFMMHFSPATQWGIVESWALSEGDGYWSRRDLGPLPDADFNRQYFNLNRTFYPLRFDAERLAELAEQCGFRYLLFTTKHHDGFNMYDTAESDYKITAPDCPYAQSPKPDLTRALFDAFRAKNMSISAYYSKADWHHPDYWDPTQEAPTRNVNYDPAKEPAKWERFVNFTHRQFEELVRDYGPIDCLWLDAGWVHPKNRHQDLRLDVIVPKLRERYQAGLLMADRTCGGLYENILTPEQAIPDHVLHVPWESCITLGENFSFSFTDKLKSPRELVQIFIDILAKGGNLALNCTLAPDGQLPRAQVALLRRFGRFVQKHAEAIYETRCSEIQASQEFRFVQKGSCDYAYFLYRDDPDMPDHLFIPCRNDGAPKRVRCVRTGDILPFCKRDGQLCTADEAFCEEGRRKGIWVSTRSLNMLEAEAAECFALERT